METSRFDGACNVAIYKEFKRITNSVSLEEFIGIMPKGKFQRVKWPVLYESVKQNIFKDLTNEWNSMWEEEQLADKMSILEAQKDKYSERTEPAWRPKLGDPKQQLIAKDFKILQDEKVLLSKQVADLEKKLETLKNNVIRKRKFLQYFQSDLLAHKAKKEDLDRNLINKIENHLPNLI